MAAVKRARDEYPITRAAVWFYGALLPLALGGMWIRAEPTLDSTVFVNDQSLRADLILGLGTGLLLALLSRGLMRVSPGLQRLEFDFAQALGPLSASAASKLALLSGVVEELFFRGLLLPWLGSIASTLLFAAAHIGPQRRYWIWTAWSAAAGAAFAWMTLATGNLTAAIVAHVVANYLGLIWLGDRHEARGRNSSDSLARTAPLAE